MRSVEGATTGVHGCVLHAPFKSRADDDKADCVYSLAACTLCWGLRSWPRASGNAPLGGSCYQKHSALSYCTGVNCQRTSKLTDFDHRLDWPSAVRIALGAIAIVGLSIYTANVVASLARRKSLIKNYNMRAAKMRLPESDESAFSRTRTSKLQRDIADIDERARSFSQKTAGQSPSRKASAEKRSAPAYSESSALASSMPWGVAHYPYQPESAAPGFGWSQSGYY